MSLPDVTKTRLSEAVIWDLIERYYTELGTSAWDATPYLPTCNNYITEAYAEQAVAFLQDHAEHLNLSHPLYIVELGAGTGCFSYNFMRALISKLGYFQRLKSIQWQYVVTDIVPKNLEYWTKNGAFENDIGAGRVDFALFNAEHDKTLKLHLSGKVLAEGDFQNPIIIVANYYFDTLRNDEFRITHGVLEETLVHFEVDPVNSFAFADFVKTADFRTIAEPYYKHPVFDAILEEYRKAFTEASILFPISALRTLDNLKRLSRNRLLLLSGDKGFSYPQYMQGHWSHDFAVHGGSFSYMVNYDAIRRYFVMQGGDMLCTTDPNLDILLNIGFILEGFTGPLEWTRYCFEEKMHKQNIVNYLPIVMGDMHSTESSDPRLLKEFRAAVQISNYDADTFERHAQAIRLYECAFSIVVPDCELDPLARKGGSALLSSIGKRCDDMAGDTLLPIGRLQEMFFHFRKFITSIWTKFPRLLLSSGML